MVLTQLLPKYSAGKERQISWCFLPSFPHVSARQTGLSKVQTWIQIYCKAQLNKSLGSWLSINEWLSHEESQTNILVPNNEYKRCQYCEHRGIS